MSLGFSETIFKVGINPCVDVPAEVSFSLGQAGYIPVRGTLNGHPFRAGLVSLGGGRHHLFINGQMRKRAGVDVGDTIEVMLDYDPEPRKIPMPRLLSQALAANLAAQEAWRRLSPSRRKEILSYLNWLKRPETLERNVARTIEKLLSAADSQTPRNGTMSIHQPNRVLRVSDPSIQGDYIMSVEQNKTVTCRYIEELWTQNNLAVIDEIITPEVVGHAAGQAFRGADTLRQRAANLRAIYSDVRITVEDQIAEGDKALVRWTFRGRHTGEYLGAKPTGREVVATGMNLFRLASSRIVELWVESDDLGELQQLGVVTLPK